MSRQVAILFDNFGPYHHARLAAANSRMPILAVETCEKTAEYAWARDASASRFEHRTLLRAAEGDGQTAPSSLITKRLFEVLDEGKPGTVAIPGWSTRSALAALSWCISHQVPAVVMSESTHWDRDRNSFRERIKQRVLRLFSAALVGGRAHTTYLERLGIPGDRIFRGYDVVDNDYFSNAVQKARGNAARVRARLELPPRYFLASNRFIEKKNLPALLEAFARYLSHAGLDACRLVILGDGPLKKYLLERCGELELTIGRDVYFPGFVQYEVVPEYFALAEAFIHASTSEQWGLVVNEAMASSLPVLVSSRCGCAQDLVVEGDNGWTFDPFDIDEMAQAMKRVASLPADERQALGKRSHHLIKAYSPAFFADGLSKAAECALRVPLVNASFQDRLLLRALRSR